jgi:hypothetical protein
MQDTEVASTGANGVSADDRNCFIQRVRGACHIWIVKHAALLKMLLLTLLFVSYMSYYVMALMFSVDGATVLTIFTSIGLVVIVGKWLVRCDVFVSFVTRFIARPMTQFVKKHRRTLKWFEACLLLLLACRP